MRSRLTWLTRLGALACVGAVSGWLLSAPDPLSPDELPSHVADVENGRTMFLIGGCASCHAAKGAEGEDKLILQGGKTFVTEFGTFVAPNISPDRAAGIGTWSELEFANAMLRGVSPDGRHYYPAFPYASYARMRPEDVLDLWAYLQTLPASNTDSLPHDVGFPFSIRRGIGLWKLLYLDPAPVQTVGADLERGRYLVEGPGHCGECHTPRTLAGGLDLDRWLEGAPSPDGPGRIPGLRPGGSGAGSWAAVDIAEYLKSGFTPDYDSAGGAMVDVIDNTAQLAPQDRAAIAAYLKALDP